MSGLKAFRSIPENIIEWTRWMRDQSIPDPVSDTLLTGSATFNGTTPASVSVSEDDTDYSVFIDSDVSETFFVTDKRVGSFNLNSSNASSTASVTWLLVRR